MKRVKIKNICRETSVMSESQREEQGKARLKRIHRGERARVAVEREAGKSKTNSRCRGMSSERMEESFEQLTLV